MIAASEHFSIFIFNKIVLNSNHSMTLTWKTGKDVVFIIRENSWHLGEGNT